MHPGRDERTEKLFRRAVAHEMLLARESVRDRTLDPNDARWRLASETARALQGAMLAYEDRRRLLQLATRFGIRPFDANLIVAIVQDRARRGEALESAASTIAIVPSPGAAAQVARADAGRSADAGRAAMEGAAMETDAVERDVWSRVLVAAVLLATVVDGALIAWLILG